MLAAVASAVKSSQLPAPEQVAIDRALDVFWLLVELLKAAAKQREPIHHVEGGSSNARHFR